MEGMAFLERGTCDSVCVCVYKSEAVRARAREMGFSCFLKNVAVSCEAGE